LSQVLSESFGFFFANTRLFFHLVTIPWIMSIVIRIVGGLVSESPIAAMVEKAVDVVPTTMFMVAWQRLVLLGPHRIDGLPGLSWSSRETAWLGTRKAAAWEEAYRKMRAKYELLLPAPPAETASPTPEAAR
jgi:hypothetical protein